MRRRRQCAPHLFEREFTCQVDAAQQVRVKGRLLLERVRLLHRGPHKSNLHVVMRRVVIFALLIHVCLPSN